MKKVLENNKISAREKIENEIDRINKSRAKLDNMLKDLNTKIHEEDKPLDTGNIGFNIEEIESNTRNVNKVEIIRKRNAIEKALKQDNYCDLEFCKVAKEYIDSIREQVEKYDNEIKVNNENVEKARVYLQEMQEKREKGNMDNRIMIDNLLVPLGESVHADNSCRSGIGTLNKLENKIDNIINSKE